MNVISKSHVLYLYTEVPHSLKLLRSQEKTQRLLYLLYISVCSLTSWHGSLSQNIMLLHSITGSGGEVEKNLPEERL